MNRVGIALSALVVVLLLLAGSTLFEVQQTQQVLLTQFGQPIRVITKPGLHVKLPLVQTVIGFDNRLLDYNMPSEEVILGDQRRLIVDAFARFRITNPLQYFQAVGAQETGIRARLDSVVSSSLRRVLGNERLPDVLSAQRDRIMGQIRTEVNSEMRGFGVSVEDVRIRRADLPAENTEAVLARMQSERQRIAARARAGGTAAATEIRADADRERTVLLADAQAKADTLRGAGEARAIAVYAAAFGQDPHFFGIWRTLDAYRRAFAAGHAHLVLSPGDAFLKMLRAAPAPGP
ncbi:MAG TPA: protease modulator HflC [Acetobacteraceae bacterium]|jgi:membrane protease subunit HflC|nr:protease modulator HflC [Acetobacteraceae bacterium]